MATRVLVCCALAFAVCSLVVGQEAGIVLSTERPGNLFDVEKTIEVDVSAPGVETVRWMLVDYWWENAAEDAVDLVDGEGRISVPRQAPGYYELTATAGDKTAVMPLGVIKDHSAEDPPSGRINVDGATAWLSGMEDLDELALMLRAIGVGWVRERFSWGATEREKGKLEFAYQGRDYDKVADAFTKHGVRVYQIWHDSPGWTRPDKPNSKNPDDLRDVYNFTRRVAENYRGTVLAWEVWNEPDIGFWPDLGDTFSGVQKAAYLGLKAGNPELQVLLGSFCRGYCAFDESLFEAGVADYYDIFNWHIYAKPEAYFNTLARYREMLEEHGCEDRPIWLTEAGIRLNATEENGELTAEDHELQAEFMAPSFACSLAAGTDRHFFFVYPYYLERGVQFGALRKDLSPRPGFVALAAAVDILGRAEYLGRYDFGEDNDDIWGLAFETGDGPAMVIWSDAEQVVEFAGFRSGIRVADLFGKIRPEVKGTDVVGNAEVVTDGTVILDIGPSPLYVMGLAPSFLAKLTGDVRPEGKLPTLEPCPVVVRGQAMVEELNKGQNCYMIGTDAFTYQVEAVNLSETERAEGSVRLEIPEGWTCEPDEARVSLEPMGRATPKFTLRGPVATRSTSKVWVRPDFEGLEVAPSVSYFRFDVAKVEPAAALDLELDDSAKWTKNIAGIGSMEVSGAGGGAVRFAVKFTGEGDRWCYPRVNFDAVRDWSEYDGLSLEYRTEGDDAVFVRTQVIETGGSAYLGELGRAADEWKHTAILFEDLGWGSWSQPDKNGKLDLNDVGSLMIGLNTGKDDVVLEVRNLQVFKLED